MVRKKWFIILLGCCFATVRPGQSQVSQISTTGIDSLMTLPARMLNLALIDSLLNLMDDKTSPVDFLSQLKIKSLHGRYLLQNQKNGDWYELYAWCNTIEPLCRKDDEIKLLVRLYSNASVAFKRLGRLSDSKEASLKSTESLRLMKNPDYSLSGSVYVNAGNALKQIGEFERSIQYFKQSIQFFDEFLEKSKTADALVRIAFINKSTALENLGLVYQSLGDHQEAIKVFRNCIEFKELNYPEELNDVYSDLVISLIEVSKHEEAKQILETIIHNYPTGMAKDLKWALAKLNLIDVNFRMAGDKPTKVDTDTFFHELDLLNIKIGKEIPEAVDVRIVVSQLAVNLLLQQKKYPEALQKWSEAMKSLTGQEFSPFEIPHNIKTSKTNKLIELVNLNAQIYFAWSENSNKAEDSKKAEERYIYTLQLIDSLRSSLDSQSDKLQVSRMQRASYDQLIKLRYSIFTSTGDSAYIDRVFDTMEQSKSAGFWSSVRDIEVKSSQIPLEELNKELAIRKKITDIQGLITEARSAPGDNEVRVKELQQQLFLSNLQGDSLILVYRQKYPDYYKAKFDRSTISLLQVRQLLTPDQILIEYAIAYDSLFTLAVSKSTAILNAVPISKKSNEDIAFILDFMKGHVESLTNKARNRYCEAATGLFDLLLVPCTSLFGSKELLIIPDGSLSYIPFEALLEPQPIGSKQDYRKLPYLIRSHSISYGLTATVFFYKSARVINPSRRVLAVAPDYSMSTGKISDYIRKAESGLPELKGTYQESKAIKRMFGGRLLTGDQATELKFKSIVPKYSILHLAMHTIPDSVNSLKSSLVFTPGADKIEDGVLFGYEVQNLSLNAWLTVLSACETGTGQMAGGEGILSFGRAFTLAGCPNLVMTLWTVDDRSSQEIMVTFYRSLLAGSGIADALQHSKLAYLERADQLHAHPHFWAGFIELGQNQVINIKNNKTGLIYLLLVVCITVAILAFLQLKKNPRRSRDIMETE